MSELTAERAREVLDYDPETGALKWKVFYRRPKDASVLAGVVKKTSQGKHLYRQIAVDGRSYLAHRLVWLIVFGRWPEQLIDHINGDGLDNRIANLRECTPSQNMYNMRLRANNTSGFKGVYPTKKSGRFAAQIKRNGKNKYLGTFDSAQEAHTAYCEAADELHGEFANYGANND